MNILNDDKLIKRNNRHQALIDDPDVSIDSLKAALSRRIKSDKNLLLAKKERAEYQKLDTEFKTLKEYAFKGFATNLSGHEMAGVTQSLSQTFRETTDKETKRRGESSLVRIEELFQGFYELNSSFSIDISHEYLTKIIRNISQSSSIEIDSSCLNIDQEEIRCWQKLFVGVVYNLISNALSFSDDKVDKKIVVLFKDKALYVSDNGPGVPENDLPKLFSFGFTNRVNGHGLGLALCKEFANISNYDLEYTPNSEFNVLGGACFKFNFNRI